MLGLVSGGGRERSDRWRGIGFPSKNTILRYTMWTDGPSPGERTRRPGDGWSETDRLDEPVQELAADANGNQAGAQGDPPAAAGQPRQVPEEVPHDEPPYPVIPDGEGEPAEAVTTIS